MRKRIVAAILALAMSVSMMACGAKSDSKQENTATTKEVDSMSFDELKKEKYRFTKAKEKYKSEHEGELRRFYMVKRRLQERGVEQEPFPLKAWQREFSELSAQREVEYQEYKLLQKDLTLLYQIKGDVDKAMRETHLEMLHPDKTKETETTL